MAYNTNEQSVSSLISSKTAIHETGIVTNDLVDAVGDTRQCLYKLILQQKLESIETFFDGV